MNKIDERAQIYSPSDVDNLIVMAIEKCARKCSEYEDYHWKLYQANPNSHKAWDHQTRANAAANCESAILALRSEFLPQPSANPPATIGTGVTPAADTAKPPESPVAWIEHHKGGDNLCWDYPGTDATPLYSGPRQKPSPFESACKLVYNKATKRIDKVRSGDGLVLESFEPPIEE